MSAAAPDAGRGSATADQPATRAGERLDRLEAQFSLLYAILRHRMRARAATIDPALQPAGLRTLTVLMESGPSNPTLIAEMLGFDRSVLSRQLQQLLRLGLVERRPDPLDGRAALIRVTDAAHERITAATHAARDSLRDRLDRWSDDDLDDLVRLLGMLSADAVQDD